MAGDSNSGEDQSGAVHAPRECMPCRGTGSVISNLGGTPATITCPWCEGAGVRVPGANAQAKWPANEPPEQKPPPQPAEGEPVADASS